MSKDSKLRQEHGNVLSFIPTGEYYFNKGVQAFDRHDIKKARKYLQRAAQLDPNDPVIACQLAIIYTHCEEFQQAIDIFRHILEKLDPSMVECHFFLANNYAELGFFNEALYHARQYLEKDPFGEYREEAEELIYMIDLDDGELESISYEQDELMIKQEEARRLLEAGNFEMALNELNKLIEKYPDFWSGYNNIALAYFYLGQAEKAIAVLEDLLEKNPGNLHALCNLAVFFYHKQDDEKLEKIVKGLEKVRPVLIDHQYKLGATFATIGRFEEAYHWLNRLKKAGFDGDASFYYWLSQAAYYTGRQQAAESAWEQLIELNPGKKGYEPWNRDLEKKLNEKNVQFILNRLNSGEMPERLFGIFLIGLSSNRSDIVSHPDFKNFEDFTLIEKIYLAHVLESGIREHFDPDKVFARGHNIACILHGHYGPMFPGYTDLMLVWFSIFLNGLKHGERFKNEAGFAAATDYLWHRQKGDKVSQQAVAAEYQISASTLRKYANQIKSLF
ncbi:tetratricopeptide repeat protein [Weizmannia acidilactici]|uniref:tetratricopeptide repeat protein n=1 Tax=Weizmannia acidilactici TaxID=2607726 RepID=UPI00124E975A|nr:tetratricopeptide repeat protein [Weizmannia acidilactici]GER74404.1 TPR repeat-containing protein YvcD [Weizmannia acidilactici]